MQTLTYATRDGVALCADFYSAATDVPAPIIICVHGGAWKVGDRGVYRHLGPFLARAGYNVFAIDYRLTTAHEHRHPAAADDVRAALQYVRTHAVELNADPLRVGLAGDSAGGHLAALTALSEPENVRVLVGIYGVYDLAAQWVHDCVARPHDNIAEALLGVALTVDRRAYFDASPLSYVTSRATPPAVLLAWGTQDDIVEPAQSEHFRDALKAAGFYVRTVTLAAGHFWCDEPLDEVGSPAGFFAPRLLRFLDERLR